MNLTLVALYGPKPPALADLISTIQTELSDQLGNAYVPYAMDQIHATLIGLEGYCTESGILNSNLLETEDAPPPMDLEGLFRFLLNTPLLPLNIRIGGFRPSESYPFTSRGQHPCTRSFGLNRREAVVIGWPVNENTYPLSLDKLRRRCMDYHVLHKYHLGRSDIDNDLFLVMGCLRRDSISPEEYTTVERCIRKMLSSRQSLDISVGPEALSVVAYDDRSLPTSSSRSYPLAEIQDGVEFLTDFYQPQ